MKKCYRCRENKEESDYHRDRTRHDGLSAWCKDCRNDYAAHYRTLDYVQVRNNDRAREGRIRRLANRLLGADMDEAAEAVAMWKERTKK